MLLPNLSFTPAVLGPQAVPTGDAGDARDSFRIRRTLQEVKLVRAEQKFPNGPPAANGEAGEWKAARVKTPGCCGIDSAKPMTVWVFDKDPKTGVAFETQQEVELFTGFCSTGGICFGVVFLVGLAIVGTGIGIGVWQSSIDRPTDWANRPPPPPWLG